jgi:hypothetical protein
MQFNLNRSIEILERTPNLIEKYLTGLSEEWIYQNEGDDTWNPFDIVGHLIHGEKTDWITRAKIIVYQEGDKTFSTFDRFAQFNDSKGKSLAQLLEEFKLLRNDNLNELRVMNITENMLELEGIHPELGIVKLRQLISTWVVHDLGHIAQISRVMAHQYRDEVGPWKNYLRIIEN